MAEDPMADDPIARDPVTGDPMSSDRSALDPLAASPVAADLIKPGQPAFRLELTAVQMKIVHTALKSMFDDLGREEHDVRDVVASVLAKLPGEHDIRAIDLDRELHPGAG
jgi:hypothetical protein